MSTGTYSTYVLFYRYYTMLGHIFCQIPTETFHETTITALQLLLLRQTGVATDAQLLVFDSQRRNNIVHTHAKFQVCSSGQFLNQFRTNKQKS